MDDSGTTRNFHIGRNRYRTAWKVSLSDRLVLLTWRLRRYGSEEWLLGEPEMSSVPSVGPAILSADLV